MHPQRAAPLSRDESAWYDASVASADLIRLMTLDGQVVGAGMLVALVWVAFTVRNLDRKVTGLDSKVSGLDMQAT